MLKEGVQFTRYVTPLIIVKSTIGLRPWITRVSQASLLLPKALVRAQEVAPVALPSQHSVWRPAHLRVGNPRSQRCLRDSQGSKTKLAAAASSERGVGI